MTDRYPAELNTVARVKIGVGGVATSARRWLDLVAGTGVSLTPVDDGVNEKVTVTVGVTGAPPTGNAGGDLTGTYPNPTIGAGKVVTAGIADANVTAAKLASEAWTAWTPTITANTGTITTAVGAGAWYRTGRMITYRMTITITTNGTGAGWVIFTLPVNDNGTTQSLGAGSENGVTSKMVYALHLSTSTGLILFYDGTYPGGDGRVIYISGRYEAAT